MSQLTEFRKEKDTFFSNDHHSPLTQEQKQSFDGLKYFPEAPELSFALEIEEFDSQEQIQMQTSTGDVQSYIKFGKVKYQIEGVDAELTVYKSHHGFFIPFVDSQSGEITYGAGRYLDPNILPDGKLQLDFNLAYNPYCAYNENYSCPIPPVENRLGVPIKAGEKNYK